VQRNKLLKKLSREEFFKLCITERYKSTKHGISTVIIDSLEEKWGLNLLREGSPFLRIMARKSAET
jgi:peptidyl-tRNA hydrolase